MKIMLLYLRHNFVLVDGGNLGLESDGNLTYNPFTGKVTANRFQGDLIGNSNTATKISSIFNTNIVQLAETQTLTHKTLSGAILTNNPVFTDTSSGNNFILNLGANIQADTNVSLPQLTGNDTFVFQKSHTNFNK